MEKIKLTEICDPKQWKTISTSELTDEGYPVYGANGVIGYYSEYNHENETVTVTCRGATCGTVNITTPKSYITGNAMCMDNLRQDISIKYLYYALKNYDFSKVISGSAQPQITRQNLNNVQIKIVSKTKQLNIVNVLESVSLIVDKRKMQLELLDNLIKSRFVELFGDQQLNPFGFDKGTIRDIVTEVKYGTSKPAVDGGKYKYLRMNNITYGGELDLTSLKYIDITDKEYEKCVVRKGDVLFNRTNSKELVGKTCVFNIDEEMIIAGYIIRVRLNERALPVYLSALLNSQYGKETLQGMCKAIVGQANINAQELQDIDILIPPIKLQQEFTHLKEQVDKLKFEVQKSLDETQTLFESLMQKYFD